MGNVEFVWADLPTPDVLVVHNLDGAVLVVADVHLTLSTVTELVKRFSPGNETFYALD